MFKLTLSLLLAVSSVYAADPCSITMPTDLPDPMPVFITEGALFRPYNITTELAEGQELTLHCGGSKNTVETLKKQTVTLTCKNGAFTYDGNNYKLADLKCSKIPTSDLQVTETTCADEQGVIFEAGFKVEDNFYIAFKICYDTANERTLYSESIVNGAAQSFKINESTRRTFRADGMKFSTTATNKYYKTTGQITRFESLFGKNQPYVSSTMFMARGHLAPDADFVFAYEQLATYYYANCAPEWQVVNAGNWVRVESETRKLAQSIGSDLLTYTSTLGVLELEHPTTGVSTPIYLGKDDVIPAPEWYYKVVMHPSLPVDLVFISLNNPFANVGPEVEFCTNVCAKYNVNSNYYTDATKGYTFCCELKDFWKSAVGTKTPFFDLPDGWSYKNKMFKLTLSLLLAVSSVYAADPCSITMPTDLPDPMPVFITEGALFRPYNITTELAEGQELTLHCGGSKNTVETLKKQTVTLTCKNGAFTYDGNNYKLADLKCSKIPTSDLQVTETTCADEQGVIFEAGFKVEDNFYIAFKICYDTANERTLYSESIVNGAAQSFKINESTRRTFRADGMKFSTTATNKYYKTTGQITRFESLFGKNQPYVSSTMFMARGHLAPDADFVFAYEQLATYYYANCAPEWQVVNAGNWVRVESETRKLAQSIGSDLLTYTSTLGVLELEHPTTGVSTPIYLGKDDVIPAPEWYYKVVMHPSLPVDLVFISLNNPFANVGPEVEFCTNVCAKYNVNSNYYTDATKGYTFCCELKDFWKSAVGTKTPFFDLPDGWSYKNKMFKLTLNLLLAVSSVYAADPCSITMPTDLPDPMPVFITEGALFRPYNITTELAEGQELTLHCGGSKNTVETLKKQTVTLTCKNGAFTYDGNNYKLADLKCSKIPTSDLQVTETTCADEQGVIFEAGFKVEDNFYIAFKICYDTANERTLYSESIVNGAAQSFKINESTRRTFRADGMKFSTTATNKYYKTTGQITRFESLFGKNQPYVSSTMFMARGHLAPDADFVFAYEQLATYYYANCAPEWQVVNAGNWVRVESETRKLAQSIGSDLLTYTSTLGVLELEHPTTGVSTPIYLGKDDVIPAPEWYYKVVMHPSLPVDLVFISLNNPFANVGPEVEFCTNVCAKYNVNSNYYTDATKGYTFCCELKDFWKSAVGTKTPFFDLPDGWSYKK
ncbi:uncharacterized protein [Eurosta solidaginis]|uniref:uncharacterized protein n=1 Tax=Eurosta solidaginis TaxID=178769 RepID=UPI0035311910